MDDKKQTKSSDFLPGKPSVDGMAAVSVSPSNSTNPGREGSSAHVIDLKKTAPSIVDSPLLKEENELTKEDGEKAVSLKVSSDQANKSEDALPVVESEPRPIDPKKLSRQESATENTEGGEKGINDISLAPAKDQLVKKPESANTNKKSKLRTILVITGIIVVIAVAVVAVIIFTSTSGQ